MNRAFLTALIFLMLCCAGNSAVGDRARELVEALTTEEMDGRRSGTPGGDRATAWLDSVLQQTSLEHWPGLDTYRHDFRFVKDQAVEQAELTINGVTTASEDWLTLPASSDCNLRDLPLVFCGYGLSFDDGRWSSFGDVDLSGKAALIVRQGPWGERPRKPEHAEAYMIERRVAAAKKAGAALVMVADNPFDKAPEASRGNGPDPVFGDTGHPLVAVSATLAAQALEQGGEDLSTLLSRVNRRKKPKPPLLLPVHVELSIKQNRTWAQGSNLLARIPGRAQEKSLLLGAHYDHLGHGPGGDLALHPGADDNASGTAALLLMAEQLDRTTSGSSILLAFFGGEELGRLGSRRLLVDFPWLNQESLSVVFNLDMVGRLADNGAVDVLGLQNWQELAAHMPDRTDGLAPIFRTAPAAPGGDHESFLHQQIPAIMVFTGPHEDYHTPGDTPDKLDYAGIERIANSTANWVNALRGSTLELAPPRQGLALKQDNTKRVTAGIGITPAYQATEEGGMQVAAVRAGSPAAIAGLTAGDQILAVDNQPVANIFDYTHAIRRAALGDTLQVEVLTSGKRKRIRLVLEERKR